MEYVFYSIRYMSAVTFKNFHVYRCPDPIKGKTDQPWFRIEDLCPCDSGTLSNPSGRGYVPCPFGVQFDNTVWDQNMMLSAPLVKQEPSSMMFPMNPGIGLQSVPTQLEPRPLARIGTDWRSAN